MWHDLAHGMSRVRPDRQGLQQSVRGRHVSKPQVPMSSHPRTIPKHATVSSRRYPLAREESGICSPLLLSMIRRTSLLHQCACRYRQRQPVILQPSRAGFRAGCWCSETIPERAGPCALEQWRETGSSGMAREAWTPARYSHPKGCLVEIQSLWRSLPGWRRRMRRVRLLSSLHPKVRVLKVRPHLLLFTTSPCTSGLLEHPTRPESPRAPPGS